MVVVVAVVVVAVVAVVVVAVVMVVVVTEPPSFPPSAPCPAQVDSVLCYLGDWQVGWMDG